MAVAARVIAYHQPVTRAEIEEIRGVGLCKGTIDTLMEAGRVQPKGRRAGPGRRLLWVTTPDFLVRFGLDSVADLQGINELRAAGLLDLGPRRTARVRANLPNALRVVAFCRTFFCCNIICFLDKLRAMWYSKSFTRVCRRVRDGCWGAGHAFAFL